MVDLLIPIARKIPVVYNAGGIPLSLKGKAAGAVRTEAEARDLAHGLGGRDVKPVNPIIVYASDGTRVYVMGAGAAEASELEDLALAAMAKANERIKAHGRTFNFEAARSERGLPRESDRRNMIFEAFERRAKRLRGEVTNYPTSGRKR